MDRREAILNESLTIDNSFRIYISESDRRRIYNAMDEYMKICCLELLEYLANHDVECNRHVKDGPMFLYKGEWVSKEQLFENFL